MIDLNQELEDFDAYFFKRHGELPLDPSSEEYANKSYLKHEMFKAWKARTKCQHCNKMTAINLKNFKFTVIG
ncbi:MULTISPECIES: hypothetical protein [Gammaproteobacteria]|uniref:hypothetical protein n=1 Tax=Acinetobacter TaxID=469 RepID=UPI00197FF677|nr:hypothetical protein [Acinetobacter pittii]MBN6510000.1 hypothetical protein [Acinetobacter pittii]